MTFTSLENALAAFVSAESASSSESSVSTVSVGGNVQVQSVQLTSGKTVSVSQELPLSGALIGMVLDAPGLFATNVTNEEMAQCFTNAKLWQTTSDPDAKTLSFTE